MHPGCVLRSTSSGHQLVEGVQQRPQRVDDDRDLKDAPPHATGKSVDRAQVVENDEYQLGAQAIYTLPGDLDIGPMQSLQRNLSSL